MKNVTLLQDGFTACIRAAQYGHLEIVSLVMEQGVDVNYGTTVTLGRHLLNNHSAIAQ